MPGMMDTSGIAAAAAAASSAVSALADKVNSATKKQNDDATKAKLAKTPEALFKAIKSEDKSIQNDLGNADKSHSEFKEKAKIIPKSITSLDVDDNDGQTAGFAPDQSNVTSGEGEKDNEYHAIQVKAGRTELNEEREKDKKRIDALRSRDINRNKTFGNSSVGKGPSWNFGNPLANVKTSQTYSYWAGLKTENETFAACWIDLNKTFSLAEDLKSKGKGFLKELTDAVAGAALGAAREAVTNVGLAVADQAARLENTAMSAMSAALDKALSPILTPISNFVSDVKETVYGAIESVSKNLNDFIKKDVFGIDKNPIEIKFYQSDAYGKEIKEAVALSNGGNYNLAKNRLAQVYKNVINEEVKRALAEKMSGGSYGPLAKNAGISVNGGSYGELSKSAGVNSNLGAYGPLSSSAGSSVGSGNSYQVLDTGVMATITETYFDNIRPIMSRSETGELDLETTPPPFSELIKRVIETRDPVETLEDPKSAVETVEGTPHSLSDPKESIASASFLAKPMSSGSNTERTNDVLSEILEDVPTYLTDFVSKESGVSTYLAAEVLQSAAKDINTLAWTAADVLCSTGKPMTDEEVMALMDSTRNRFNVLDKVTSIFNQTTAGQQTMEAINTYKPSQLINRFMLSQDSSNIGKGDMLLAATCLMDPQKKSEQIDDGTYLQKIQNLHTQIFKSPSNLGATIGHIKHLCYFDQKDLDAQLLGGVVYNNNETLSNSEVKSKGQPNIIDSLMSISEGVLNENNNFFDKVTGGLVGNTTDDFAPKPLWYGLRDGRQLFGEENLISMFRVNKLIPSGEIDYFQNGLYHLFFVKPDLNLTQNAMSLMGYHNHPLAGEIITQLNYNNNYLLDTWGENFPNTVYTHKGAHPYFSYIFSNLVKSTNIPDLNLDVKEGWENSFGGRTQFGTTTRKSYIGNDFSVTFYDTKELLLMNIITAWMKYIEIMKEGQGDCERKSYNKGTIDYLGAMYYFVMEPDNHTIAHWGRYVGIFPTSAPWSSVKLEGGSADIPEFSVNFKSEYHESNDPNILLDFNYIMRLPAYTGKAGATVDYLKYAQLASIYTSKGRRSTNDANLLGGPTRSENRAYVRMTPPITNAKAGESWGFSSSVPFKFVLEFESNMTAADAAEGLRKKTDAKITAGFDSSPDTDISATAVSQTQATVAETVGVARLDPPNLYDKSAKITYFDKLGHQLGEEYGSGQTIGSVGWEPLAGDESGRTAIDSKYRVKIVNAFIRPADTGTSFGNDQKAIQAALGGLMSLI